MTLSHIFFLVFVLYGILLPAMHIPPSNKSVESSQRSQNSLSLSSTEVIEMEKIVNFRDLHYSAPSRIKSGILYRCGSLSRATVQDADRFQNEFKIKTYIDLRSNTEIREDSQLQSNPIYEGFEKQSKKRITNYEQLCSKTDQIRRYFHLPLISELGAAVSIFRRMSWLDKLKLIGLLPFTALLPVSRRQARRLVIGYVNRGGLSLLYEVILTKSGHRFVEALKLLAEPNNHPVAIYCTAGKDRTGLLSMLLLHLRGASEEEILYDYSLSRYAYKDMDDKSATVASLTQADLDLQLFFDAPIEAMRHAIRFLESKYGSVENYVMQNGFDDKWIEKLRSF